MKKIVIYLLLALLLWGCAASDSGDDRAMALRSRLQGGNGCGFDATITADYGDKTYTFAMGCEFDAHGNLSFTVKEPQTIADIKGMIDGSGGKLTFDGNALSFPLLCDGQASPVSAPWIVYRTLKGGYLKTSVQEDDLLHLTIDDSYADDALQLDIWLNTDSNPVRAEIVYESRRILTVQIENFQIK